MNNSILINQDSGNTEWYTPSEIIEAARKTMGIITLDPFSSVKANETVKASIFMDEYDDPLNKDWKGNVWMNHPFSREMNKLCINKLVNEYKERRVKQACCITFAATSETWFRPLLEYPQCFLHGRTNYYLPDGTKKKGVTKGSVVTYLGNDKESFYEAFKGLGTIKVKY
jgi:phage N-6-adenine-methyltransferase